MSIKTALKTMISTTNSSWVGERAYSRIAPEKAEYPLITYNLVSNPQDYTLTAPVDLQSARFQINVWATTADAAETIAASLKAYFSGFKGTVSTVNIQAIFIKNEADEDEVLATTPQLAIHGVRFDAIIKYKL